MAREHPCDKSEDISSLQAEQRNQSAKIDTVIRNQQEFAADFKQAFTKLTDILVDGVRHGDAIAQLQKDVDALGKSVRMSEARIDAIEKRNAASEGSIEGSGIFQRFPKVWDWYQREQGWRRFIPGAVAVITLLILLFETFVR